MPILDFIGTVVLTAVMVVNVNAVISSMEVPRTNRLVMATIAGLWIGLQVALASAGAYTTAPPTSASASLHRSPPPRSRSPCRPDSGPRS